VRPPLSTLSRRRFLVGAGTLGAAASVGHAETTPASDASKPDWSLDATNARNFEPELLADGTVYAFARTDVKGTGPGDRSLLAFDAATGDQRWSQAVPSIALTPTLVDGTLCVSTTDDPGGEWNLVALDAETGDESWTEVLSSDSVPLPAVDPETVFVVRESGLVALDAETGERNWTFGRPVEVFGRPLVDGSTAYFGVESGVYAVSTRDGTKRWRADTSTTERAFVLATDDDRVYCSNGETAFALDTADGRTAWTTSLHGYPASLLDGGTLYLWTDAGLSAVDVETGVNRWTYDGATTRGGGLVLADGALFAAAHDELQLHVVNVDDGSRRWSAETSGRLAGGFWGGVRDGVAYVAGQDGLAARSLDDGTEQWTFQTDERSRGVVVGDDSLVFGTRESLYGFDLPESRTLVEEATSFLGSTAGLSLSGLVVGTGAFAAYRRLNDGDADDGDVDDSDADGAVPSAKQSRDDDASDDVAPDDERLEYGRLERLAVDAVTETHRVRKRAADGPRVVVETRLTDPDLVETFRAAVDGWDDLGDRDGVVPVLDHADHRVELPALDGSLADADRPFADRVGALSDANLTVHRAHRDGLVHGGVTPSAIRLDGDDALVADWELGAALVDHRAPSPFDAPEQLDDDGGVDERTDVYRLGATAAAVLDVNVVDGDLASATDLEQVLATATATDPDDRYESVVAFDDMLRWATLRS
jgi:outer membrane protein assembly factor BamB